MKYSREQALIIKGWLLHGNAPPQLLAGIEQIINDLQLPRDDHGLGPLIAVPVKVPEGPYAGGAPARKDGGGSPGARNAARLSASTPPAPVPAIATPGAVPPVKKAETREVRAKATSAWTLRKKEELVLLVKEGMKPAAIAAHLGVDASRVHNMIYLLRKAGRFDQDAGAKHEAVKKNAWT